ncbi:hypothetical protein [Shigella sp. FC1655]|uniref:hypothetical protein n=1 Tax=unclassified Shigella TaxID=2629414 RepID=UPI000847D823|nr:MULTISPECIES: hypothetical protein [unclassified Shigella]ODQ07371.1 hypothetical protein BGK50_16050 [Shigella sp. FC130]OEI94964.1 hypothetical protein BHE86_15045 [Shigella sp. FC1655]
MTILIYIFCVFLFLFLFIVPKNKEKLRPLKKYLFNKFTLNENSLHEQGLFWFAILFPLYSSLCFIFLLGWDYPFKWDAIGFNDFLNIHKFSLGILALSPILGAFVVSAHRSIQTAKQIEVTEKKNKVDIYYTRRKFIKEQLSDIKTLNNEKISNPNILYMKFFTLSGNYNENKEVLFIENLNYKLKTLNGFIFKLTSSKLMKKPDIDKLSADFNKNKADNFLLILRLDSIIYQLKTELEITVNTKCYIFNIIKKCSDELANAEKNYDDACTYPISNDDPDYDYHEEMGVVYEMNIDNSFNEMVEDIILYIKNILDTLKDIYLILFNDTDFENDLPGLSHCYEHIKNWRQSGDKKPE